MLSLRRRNSGFTLVELLVVIAIIGILVSMLLPAVQMVREASRRTSCANNVRQLVLALHNFESAHRSFPPGHQESGTTGPTYRHQYSWQAYLLPFVEQSTIYDMIDFREFDPALSVNDNDTLKPIGKHNVPVFICISDPVGRVTPPDDWAPTNYLANQGTLCSSRGHDGNGVFGHDSWIKIAEISDGTSNTIAVGEILKGDWNPGTVRDNYIYTRNADAQDIDSCQSYPPERSDLGGVWLGGKPQNNLFCTDRAPNDQRYDAIAPNFGCTNFAARSGHPGGVNLGFADGSVHFITNDINRSTYQALGTRNGGEVVDAY